MLSAAYIKEIAVRTGFDLCGITRCRHLGEREAFFKKWLDEGRAAGLGYLHRNIEKRFDPAKLVGGAKSVIVCGVGYKNAVSDGYSPQSGAKIASYACTYDYHKTIKDMLHEMSAVLKERYTTLSGRIFVDSAPIAEKQFAVEAGLGWIGRQSLLVNPQFGTFVLLGEIVLSEEVDCYDYPLEHCGCGECRRCIDVCPVGAVMETRSIDASKCISCATVEANFRSDSDDAQACNLNGWIFGCDECQSCCPYNSKAPYHNSPAFDMQFDPTKISPEEWLQMSDEEFTERFSVTPLSRSGLDGLKRNL